MGDYKNSIADYDASIKLNPRDAWSLYGRGIDKLRTQQSKAADEDIAQAKAIWPEVVEEFKQRGIVP
jgi:tetratricopeptide (TPR) repeat protein